MSAYILEIVPSPHLALTSLAVCLGINCRSCGACVASLILNESKAVLNILEPGEVCVPEHVRMQLADAGFLTEFLHLLVYATVYHSFAFCAGQQRVFGLCTFAI